MLKQETANGFPKLVSFASLKGGTGKTIITFNVAGILAERGARCLVIDFDPQFNTTSLLYDYAQGDLSNERMSQEIFLDDTPASELIIKSNQEGIDFIPTDISLTGVEIKVSSMIARESILKHWLRDNEEYLRDYDYIFFDTNPTMSVININTFLVADSIFLVSDIDVNSIGAVNTFMTLYYPIRERVGRELHDNIRGLVVNRVRQDNKMAKDFMDFVYGEDFPLADIRLETYIHDAVDIARTKVNQQVIGDWAVDRAVKEFNSLVDELITRGDL